MAKISKFNSVMVQWHLNYYPSAIWNEEERKEWQQITIELIDALKTRKTEKYEAEMKRVIKKRLQPLAVKVGVRYVRDNKIVEGVENLKDIIFENPERKIEIVPIDDENVAINEKQKLAYLYLEIDESDVQAGHITLAGITWNKEMNTWDGLIPVYGTIKDIKDKHNTAEFIADTFHYAIPVMMNDLMVPVVRKDSNMFIQPTIETTIQITKEAVIDLNTI